MLRFADSAPYTKYKIKRVPGQQTKSCTPKENNCFYRKEKTTHKTGNTAVMRKLRKLEADSDQSTTAPKGQQAATRMRKAITSQDKKNARVRGVQPTLKNK